MILFIRLLNARPISFPSLCTSPLHNHSAVIVSAVRRKASDPHCAVKRLYSSQLSISRFDCQIITSKKKCKCKQMTELCLACQCEWIQLRLAPLALTSCPPSPSLSPFLPPSRTPDRACEG